MTSFNKKYDLEILLKKNKDELKSYLHKIVSFSKYSAVKILI